MKILRAALLTLTVMVTLNAVPTYGDDSVRHLPAHDVPVPDTVSPAMRVVIGSPLPPMWDLHPKSAEHWKALITKRANEVAATLPDIRERVGRRGSAYPRR